MEVSGTWMTTRYQYLSLDILTQSYHLQYTGTSHPPAHTLYSCKHTYTHSRCSHKDRTWMPLSLLSNFLLMGPQTISCFHLSYWFDLWSTHCLSWVQNLKIYRLSQVEEAVKGEKSEQAFVVSLESWPYSEFFCAFLNSTRHSSAFGCIDKLNYAGSNCLFDLMKTSSFKVRSKQKQQQQQKSGVVFRLHAFIHHIYWLPIFVFPAVLTELAGCCFK